MSWTALALFRRGSGALTAYFHSSVQPLEGRSQRAAAPQPTAAFPSPPPYGWASLGPPPASRRRRRRWDRERSVRLWVNMLFVYASWLARGGGRHCAASDRAGRQLTSTQQQVAAHVRCSVMRLSRLASPGGASGGRKFGAVVREIARMRQEEEEAAAGGEGAGDGVHVPLTAARIKFAVTREKFVATDFLDPFAVAALLEPRVLRNRVAPAQAPFPRQQRKEEALALAKRGDRVDRLRLYLESEVPPMRRSPLTSVAKSEEFDRLIMDRRAPNAEEARLRRASRDLAPGWRLCDLELAPGLDLVVYSTDLKEMFFAFATSEERSETNCLPASYRLEELEATEAYTHFARAHPNAGPNTRVLLALHTLPMGDGNAVDFAQEAHATLLCCIDAWVPGHRVLGSRPLPRGRCLEFLTVDDHLGLAMVQKAAKGPGEDVAWRTMEQVFQNSLAGYAKSPGLEVNREKTQWAARKVTALGAEIDGRGGIIGSPLERRGALAWVTMEVLLRRRASPQLWRQVVGLWTYAACFAKPSLCLFDRVYGLADAEEGEVSDEVQAKLLGAVLFAPLMEADVRAGIVPLLYCTDASPTGSGAVVAPVGCALASELWRTRAVRGGHTRLAGEEEALRIERGDSEAGLAPSGLLELRGQLPVLFDFLEVCSGPRSPLTCACARRGLVVGPAIDVQRFTYWDLLQEKVFVWLAQLCGAGRVFYLHLAPPCTTFSQARRPPLRSKDTPLGCHPQEPRTREGNRLLLRCLFLLRRQDRAGRSGTLEHPRGALTRHVPQVRGALADWLDEGVFSMCSFGEAWRKDTSLYMVRTPFLTPMLRPCCGGHRHVRLGGGAPASKAAEYPRALCEEWSGLIRLARDQQSGDFPAVGAAEDPRAVESPWLNSVVRSCDFKEVFWGRWRKRRHINLQELATLRMTVDYALARHGCNQRVLVGVDSLVTCSVANKGRSASKALNGEWRRAAGAMLCGGLRLATHYVPSRHNPADAPSRGRQVPRQQARRPTWWRGSRLDEAEVDRWTRARCRREVSAWAELVLRLTASRQFRRDGKNARTFLTAYDANGLEGDGPRNGKRKPADLIYDRGLAPATTKRRDLLLWRLHQWLQATRGASLAQLWVTPIEIVDEVLALFGQFMYDQGGSLHDFSETINAVVDVKRGWRRATTVAWDVAKSWRRLVPVQSHRPMPLAVLLAMQGVAVRRGWLKMAAALALGFAGLLRPNELVKLQRRDILLPAQVLGPRDRMWLKLGRTKTAGRGGALHQHVRIDDAMLVAYLAALCDVCLPSPFAPLFAGGAVAFRRNWNVLLTHLGIPCMSAAGFTPASLRAGGATFLFMTTQDVKLVKWRGRWVSERTLEIYLQEVACESVVASLPSEVRERVLSEAAVARAFVQCFPTLSFNERATRVLD